jgi:hypothetical protein
MAISEKIRRELYERAGGRCECTMRVCDHHPAGQRCPRNLVAGYWDAHHISTTGGDSLSNLIAMCATCHKNTRSYGRT